MDEERLTENEATMSEGSPSQNQEPHAEDKAEDKSGTQPTGPENQPEGESEKPKKGFKAWWQAHKPTKRRIIQLYTALLVNANIKGYVTGRIFSGATKYACVPGLNCYSCPGAVGACPLGALQNAFAQSGTRLPFYVLGIIILYGIILGRTICGFLCPFGLVQDLTYKIKTPKVKKSRFTRVLSYLKYVLLAVFVVALPLIFGLNYQTAVPAFCKYICPAGVIGGAVPLLINSSNASMFDMLGGLFTWKFCLMVAILIASIFIYRIFCRFLCPLGALYGFFNKIALLGIKLDKNKCTDCGLCVAHCKMDIKRVGDHECINCGECIAVCPAKAISWKGSKLFVHENAVEPIPVPVTERPIGSAMLTATVDGSPIEASSVMQEQEGTGIPSAAQEQHASPSRESQGKKRGKAFWLEMTAWIAAGALLVGALVYFNACDHGVTLPPKTFTFTVDSLSGSAGEQAFTIEREGKRPSSVSPKSGSGREDDPYVLDDIAGKYVISLHSDGTGSIPVTFTFTLEEDASYTVTEASDDLSLEIFYTDAAGKRVDVYSYGAERSFTLSVAGNRVGDSCADFTLPYYLKGGAFTLSDHRGKVVIINFWATWCGPCVTELPEFERIKEEYGNRVEVVAVHSSHITEDVVAFLNTKEDALDPSRAWKDWQISFVQDSGTEPRSDVYDALGGRDSYPMTVIVDGEGRIVFKREGSVSYNDLSLQMRLLLET